METPFAREKELAEKSARLKELNILLNMDQKDRSVLDDGPAEESPEKEKQREEEQAALLKERRMQEAMLSIKKKFGKNAVLKGMNLQEGATTKDRNNQIGGHKA
jgi:hypothetical protein